jgi:NAD(P)-dependent dehydrogenase (short-subunit alcohol dehydrogenase family)
VEALRVATLTSSTPMREGLTRGPPSPEVRPQVGVGVASVISVPRASEGEGQVGPTAEGEGVFDLTGRVAVVTGGSKGIGRCCALALAAAGADVVINGHRDLEAGERTADEVRALGRRSVFVAGDVTDPQAVQALVDRAVAELGGLHIMVNNAMSPSSGGDVFSARAIESWPLMVGQILSAPFYCCRAAGKHMSTAGGGSIINIASTGARKITRDRLNTGLAAYFSSKAGLVQLTRVLAAAWAPLEIRVNSISPGYTRTDASKYIEDDQQRLADVNANTPLGRMGEPSEIAGAAVYLASDAASYTTGIDLTVDGGLTIW